MIIDMRYVSLVVMALLLLVSSGCRRGQATAFAADGFRDTLYAPRHAGGFCILGAPGCASVMVESRNPWQGADSVCTRLLILRDGEQAPEGFDGQILYGDAARVVAMSSTHVAMLDALGRAGNIVGVSGRGFISTPLGDDVADVGYDGNIDYEALTGASPDLVLLYGVGAPSAMEGKLRELGIPYVYVGEYLEESPVGKAEWLVAIGETAGIRDAAERRFDAIDSSYTALCRRVDSVGARPRVMLNTPYGDAWFMPTADNYMARLISDAGADYVCADLRGNKSATIDIEQAYMLASGADFWLNTGQTSDMRSLLAQCPRFADTAPVLAGRVYNNTLRSTPGGGNDFYESAIVHPDLVLRDLIKIFHPELVGEKFTYYRKVE